MTNKRKRARSADDTELDVTDVDAMVEAQNTSMQHPDARGYLGVMSQEDKEAMDAHQTALSNAAPVSTTRHTGVAPAMLGRDPDAEVEMLEEGEGAGPDASRVGFRSVQHPRARTASALHDALGDSDASSLTADELRELTEGAGLTVEGTGVNGAVLKSDLLQAVADVRAEYPRATTSAE